MYYSSVQVEKKLFEIIDDVHVCKEVFIQSVFELSKTLNRSRISEEEARVLKLITLKKKIFLSINFPEAFDIL